MVRAPSARPLAFTISITRLGETLEGRFDAGAIRPGPVDLFLERAQRLFDDGGLAPAPLHVEAGREPLDALVEIGPVSDVDCHASS